MQHLTPYARTIAHLAVALVVPTILGGTLGCANDDDQGLGIPNTFPHLVPQQQDVVGLSDTTTSTTGTSDEIAVADQTTGENSQDTANLDTPIIETEIVETTAVTDPNVETTGGEDSNELPVGDNFTLEEEQALCSDTTVDANEDCVGDELKGATCESRGYNEGELTCSSTCRFDESACTDESPEQSNGSYWFQCAEDLPGTGTTEVVLPEWDEAGEYPNIWINVDIDYTGDWRALRLSLVDPSGQLVTLANNPSCDSSRTNLEVWFANENTYELTDPCDDFDEDAENYRPVEDFPTGRMRGRWQLQAHGTEDVDINEFCVYFYTP